MTAAIYSIRNKVNSICFKNWKQSFLLFAIGCLFIFGSLYNVKEKNETVESVPLQTDEFIKLKSNGEIWQRFKIVREEGITTEKIGIAVKKEKQVSGFLQVDFFQREQLVQSEKIAFPNMLNESYYDIKCNFEKFYGGEADIRIRYVGFDPQDTVLVMAGREALNLEPAKLDGQSLDKSVAIKLTYQVSELSKAAAGIRKIMIVSMILLLGAAVYLFCFTFKNRLTRFILGGALFCMMSLRYFSLILNYQPFAEELNVYVDSALRYGFWENLLVKDAGYLAIGQHAVSWIFCRILEGGGMKWIPLIMNATGVAAIAYCCVFPIGRLAEDIVYKPITFLSAIAIPTLLVRQYESFIFLNFIYFAGLLFLTLNCMDFQRFSIKECIVMYLLSGLAVLSKGYFVVFLPVSLIGILCCLHKDRRKAVWYLIVAICALIQLAVYFTGSDPTAVPISLQMGIADAAVTLVTIIGKIFSGIFIPYLTVSVKGNFAIGTLFILSAGIFFVYLYAHKNKNAGFFAEIMILMAGSVFLSALSTPMIYQEEKLSFSRQEFLGILALLSGVSMMTMFCRNVRWQGTKIGNVMLLYMFICGGVLTWQSIKTEDKLWVDSPNTPAFSVAVSETTADWHIYSDWITADCFYIPNTPDYWYYAKNSAVYLYSNVRESAFWKTKKTYTMDIAEPILQDKNYHSLAAADLTGRSGGLTAVFIDKESLQCKYQAVCSDKKGNILAVSNQINDARKRKIGFVFQTPVDEVYTISFFDAETNKPAWIKPEIVLVYTKK